MKPTPPPDLWLLTHLLFTAVDRSGERAGLKLRQRDHGPAQFDGDLRQHGVLLGRLLKKASDFVLNFLKSSTYPSGEELPGSSGRAGE
ncbi:MAG: hypothetical protein ABIU05_23405 [Nitrospirales bacterium]